MTRRNLIKDATRKPRTVRAERPAVDEFGELPSRKSTAIRIANLTHGHQMGPWKKRKNESRGIFDCYCVDCNMIMAVAIEPSADLGVMWGMALTTDCAVVTLSLRLS